MPRRLALCAMSDWRDDDHFDDDWPVQSPGEGIRVLGEDGEEQPQAAPRRPVGRFPLPGDSAPPAAPRQPRRGRRPGSDDSVELPHWTEPPTGQVPRVLGGTPDDDFEPWAQVTGQGPRFRTGDSDWAGGDWAEGELYKDETMGLGALPEHPDERHAGAEDLAPPRRGGRGRRPERGPRDEPAPAAAGGLEGAAPYGEYEGHDGFDEERGAPADMMPRVITAAVVAAIALAAFAIGRGAALVLVVAIVGICALELYTAFQRSGYHPATLVGVLGSAAAVIFAYEAGERGILIAVILVIAFSLFWYLFEVVHARPTINVALTLVPFAWIGIFGAYAGILLATPVHGTGFLLGIVICAVGSDVVGYFVGRSMGRNALMPRVSPNKTVEGLVAGAVTAVVLGGLVGSTLHPWADKGIGAGIALGFFVAITAPLGDLVESMIKRDLGVKDIGGFLPGHGGFLDRFDAMLFALPAGYYWAVHLFT